MNYTDDGYAAMLLTMALSPDREEYARPYSVQEYREIEAASKRSRYGRVGKLLDADVSGLMMYLNLTEKEALRVYTLLHRTVQLTYALEGLAREGVEAVTCYDATYPDCLNRVMGEGAPVFFYHCGDPDLLARPTIAIVGIGGVRTVESVRDAVEQLVRSATGRGYAVATGGEPGVSRIAAETVSACDGTLIDVLGGNMLEHIHIDAIAEMIATGRGIALSMVHPETLFTVPHAAARNKLLFALSEAAYIFNTDGRRGEMGILQNRLCPNIYSWESYPQNHNLIARGAIPFGPLSDQDFEAMEARWRSEDVEQMSMFDLL